MPSTDVQISSAAWMLHPLFTKSFNSMLSNELLDREIFITLEEAKTLILRWREEYNPIRPHSTLGDPPLHRKP